MWPDRSSRRSTTVTDKAAFRQRMRALEEQMTENERVECDFALQKKFLDHPVIANASTVMAYVSKGCEVETRLILEGLTARGKCLALPCCLPQGQMVAREYRPGALVHRKFGILEPDDGCPVIPKEEIDLILVPALCYDAGGYRLGRGGGFYDRYLAGYTGCTAGLCREQLMVERLPREEWDIPVKLVLTQGREIKLD